MEVQNAPGGTYAVFYDLYISGSYQATYLGYNKPTFVPYGVAPIGTGYQQGDVLIWAYPVSRKGSNNHLQNFADSAPCTVYYS